jgi:hypothetical protein
MSEPKPKVERRVVMAHNVARRWLFEHAQPEFRLRVFTGSVRVSNFQRSALHGFRNGKTGSFQGVDPIPDLGIKVNGDSLYVWSRNRKALKQLMEHYERMGFETTGIW